jgi:glycosyltransferase involved in cell wall biosynthesis
MNKFDICFINLSFKPGGGNRVILELSESLERKNFNCRLISLINKNDRGFSKISDIKDESIFCFFKSDSRLALIFNLFLTLFHLFSHRNNYRVIIINNPLIAPVFGMLHFSNIYYYIQADDYRIFDDRFLIKSNLLLRFYKFITRSITYNVYQGRYLFNSQFSFEKFRQISRQNICSPFLVLPGVDLSVFTPTSQKYSRLGGHNSQPIVISTILRKHPWKGSLDFLRAVEIISETNKLDSYKFVAITNEDISNFSIPKQIEILRPKDDKELSAYLNQSDIFVVTSWWEGFGLPGLEAMACGCAVITTRNGGCNDYAVDKLNCIMYEPKDVEQLTKLILDLSHNEHLRKEISKSGIKTSQDHSWDDSASALVSLCNVKE